MNLRTSFRWLAGLALSGIAAIAMAGDAADLLKSVVELRRTLTTQAQERAKADGSQIDFVSIQNQVKAKAEEAVKGVDPAKVESAEALEWAQLFNMAGKTKESQVILTNFLATKPEGMKLYQTHSMLLSAASLNKDTKAMARTLSELKPYDSPSTLSYASLVCAYAPRIVSEVGPDRAIALIDGAMEQLARADLGDALKARVTSLQTLAVQNKIEIYRDAGQKDKAIKLLDDAIKNGPESMRARLSAVRNQLTIIGTPAPTLKIVRGYGNFPGLEALKGKVVVMDFFAHWCGPCKAAFPDMRKMYAELKDKGLEMVGVTRYYGYIGDPNVKITPDEEYAKMADFVKEHNMTWPVVFGGNENFAAYGVTAIPHVIVIGRDGTVHKLEIGYSAEIFAKFRKDVEALLAQK